MLILNVSSSSFFVSLGRHVICQIDSREDVSTTNMPMDIITDGINSTDDHQHQSLMRPHPLHVKVTLIISRI